MTLAKSILLAGALAVSGTVASASTVELTYSLAHGQNVTIAAAPSGVFTGGVWAGAFTMTNTADAFDQFLAFCLDATSAIVNPFHYTETMSPFAGGQDISGKVGDLKRLFDTGYQTVLDAIAGLGGNKNELAAGFQVSAWEILYETGPYDAGSGAFRISTAGVITAANTFLGNLGGTATGDWDLTFLQKSDAQGNPTSAGQNLVTANPAPPVAPIPLPAAGWLLLGGLAAHGAAARRRRSA